jgi:hypothetical protein
MIGEERRVVVKSYLIDELWVLSAEEGQWLRSIWLWWWSAETSAVMNVETIRQR